MNLCNLPFNRHIGICKADDSEHLLKLSFADHLLNHLGTLHASALYALAEASSGEFLLRHRSNDSINGVLRRATCKYSAPATTEVRSKPLTAPTAIEQAVQTALTKGRATVSIEIALHDMNNHMIGRFSFEWLIALT